MKLWLVVLLVVLTANLCFIPGSQFLIGQLVRQWNPLAALGHVQNLANGAHVAFILTAAVDLRVFEALEDAPGATALTALDLASLAALDPWALQRRVACHSSRSVATAVGIAVDDASALLDSLASFGLVSVCWAVEEATASPTYRPTLAARAFLVGDDSLGRMATVSNHPSVVHALANLGKVLRHAPRDDMEQDFPVKLENLWHVYATNSAGFTRGVAESVVSRLAFAVPPRSALVEVGAGSAVFGFEFLKRVESGIAVALDLPEVVAALPIATATFRVVSGSAFDSAVQRRVCEQVADADSVTVLMASFAQHFSENTVEEAARALLACKPRSRLAIVELTRPEGAFNPLVEFVPFARTFHLTLRSFTRNGAVRTSSEYERLLRRVMQATCGEPVEPVVTSSSLFPMPASLFVGSCT